MLPLNMVILCIAVDVIAMVICVLVKINFGVRVKTVNSYDNTLFGYMVSCTMVILSMDIITWFSMNIFSVFIINYIATAIYYSFHLIFSTFWVLYSDYKFFGSKKRLKKVLPILLIPVVLLTFFSFFSYKFPFFYSIDLNNEYHRGIYYGDFVLINFMYYFYAVILGIKKILINRKNNISDKKLILFIVYPALPIVAAVIQMLFYGVSITWILIALSFVIIYVNFQNTQLFIDPLTGINNRYGYDAFTDKYFSKIAADKLIFLALLDLDKFKQINDKFGHLEGDNALKIVARMIKDNVNDNDFVARLGGDEFVVVGQRDSLDEVDKSIDLIKKVLEIYNQNIFKQYQVSISIGYAINKKGGMKSKKELLLEADKNMYREKNEK